MPLYFKAISMSAPLRLDCSCLHNKSVRYWLFLSRKFINKPRFLKSFLYFLSTNLSYNYICVLWMVNVIKDSFLLTQGSQFLNHFIFSLILFFVFLRGWLYFYNWNFLTWNWNLSTHQIILTHHHRVTQKKEKEINKKTRLGQVGQ